MIGQYAPQYKSFTEDGRIAHGAYGHRIATNIPGGNDQLRLAANVLRQNPETRQCVVTLWRPQDLMYAELGTVKDIPCTISWQFNVRGDELHLQVSMRSQDVWLGMPYDVYVNTSIQRIMAVTLGLQPGIYTHCVGSLHLYDKYEDAAREARTAGVDETPHTSAGEGDNLDNCDLAVQYEIDFRTGPKIAMNYTCESPLLASALMACAERWKPGFIQGAPCPLFKKLLP